MNNKVLIVTLYGEFNFGNRLQNYALQTKLQSLGFTVDNLVVLPMESFNAKNKVRIIIKYVLSALKIKRYIKSLSKSLRTRQFISFRDKRLKNFLVLDPSQISLYDWSRYSYAVTGSDQVWHNWNTIPNELEYYYLEFVEPLKRISYAPSFGFTQFPVADADIHKKGLTEMKALSCREEEGCRLIKQLTKRNAVKVLDPTLLLNTEDWIAIEKQPSFSVRTSYLLCFFLGDVSEEYNIEISRIAKERELSVINVNDVLNPTLYAIGPDEFLYLIHHASVVCTDSFHASVFSIIFGTDLRVFKRISNTCGDMFGRLNDLLGPLGLINTVYGVGNDLSTKLSDDAKANLEAQRTDSLNYLRNSFCAI